jgi:type IV pilus assembly protein PilA
MRLNNKGFSLIEILAVIIIIGVIATIAAPSIQEFVGSGKLTSFIAYEDSMEDAATNAVLDCIANNSSRCDIPEKGNTSKIFLNTLIEDGFIDNIKDPSGGNCDVNKSFVRVENRGNLNYKFKVCLYCDSYTTDNELCE